MNSLMNATPSETMSSIDLLKIINDARAQNNEPIIRLNKFAEKIEDELEGDHYTKSVVQNLNNTESVVHHLTLDQCTLVAMRESKGVRRNVLDQLKALQTPAIPQTFSQALRLAADLQDQLAIAAPKAIALDRIADTESLFTIRDAAKATKTKERDLVALLLRRGWAYRDSRNVMQPYAEKIAAGYVTSVVTKPITGQDGQDRVFTQLRITAKGVTRLSYLAAKGVAA